MKIDGINVRGNFTWIAFHRVLQLFSFTIDFASSAYFWKHLGGDGKKVSYLSKLFPGQEYDGLEPLYFGQVSIS